MAFLLLAVSYLLLLATARQSSQGKAVMGDQKHLTANGPTAFHATCFFMSDGSRAPDWRAALTAAPVGCGLILRDYDAPDRAALAAEMSAFCRHDNRFFAVAGDRRLAHRLKARFHCPSYLLHRPAARWGVSGEDTAAVHNEWELRLAAQAGFRRVFISPVFATNSHTGARPLGPLRARRLALLAQNWGLSAYALGGMDAAQWRRVTGTQGRGGPLSGFGAIDAFAKG